ncbi:MAG: tRNA preQ1(34) S-adenosylmethionine ribosyltransferase-isomerase QueA [Candidatus Eremiobacteraeota bacterium]|nr:tRNA preQ1(34) S-adenosylmethionine ribosyltransferase-isomerase QueA [Candidatus Eremiobacteraeota bacterium]
MPAAAYDYTLPEELIAQHPAARRDASRLMVLADDSTLHWRFSDLPSLLSRGDCLVLNETRVIPARLRGLRAATRVELLLLHPARSLRYDPHASDWIALARPARRLRRGDRISFGQLGDATVSDELDEGTREIAFELRVPFETFLAAAGSVPLPPYIHNDSLDAARRYQTVFARLPGSVAAPTASLHFTEELLEAVAQRGVDIVRVALSIGLGTFRPVTAETVEAHVMHAEAYTIEPAAAAAIERARAAGRRIVAAGTTVVRALEANVRDYGRITAGEHATDLFIKPGFGFSVVGAMITNFHLPRSTLLMLVSAFAGRERILRAYAEAISRKYRFYSFGDAMFLSSKSR